MNRTVEILHEAVMAWYEVTGCKTQTSGSFSMGDFYLQDEANQVAQMLKLDDTGMSAYILLRAYYEDRLKNLNFNAFDLLANKDGCQKRLNDLQKVRDLLEHPDVVEDIRDFKENLWDAVRHYGADPDKSLFDDNVALAVLRRDAVLAVNKMRTHQFVQGAPDQGPLKFNPNVYEFWNIQSLVRAMQTQACPGISLCLIRDPDVYSSFFVFAISNGENLTVLVDKERDVHPGQKEMRHRPDREFLRRAGKYHFPYELTEVTETGNSAWEVSKKERTTMVPYQTQTVKLEEVKNLRPETVLWLAMMFDLILTKYGKELHKTPELSYTTNMLREPEAFVSANTALVRSGQYKPLAVKTLTAEDLTDDKLADQWARKPTTDNDWLVERYAHKVPDTMLNLLGEGDKALLLEHEQPGSELAPKRDSFWGLKNIAGHYLSTPFKVMDPLDFGTETELVRDQLWTARHNQMAAIQRLAEAEYEATKQDILGNEVDQWGRANGKPIGWYVDAVNRNKNALLEAVARGELFSKAPVPVTFGTYGDSNKPEGRNLLCPYGGNWGVHLGTWTREGALCAQNGALTKTHFTFIPRVAADLALLCGCTVEQLPWQLRNWAKEQTYNGNPILSRMDPKEWVLHNPWKNVRFDVRVSISQSGYNELRKKLGLPRQALPVKPK